MKYKDRFEKKDCICDGMNMAVYDGLQDPILNNTIDEIEYVIIMINDITEETKLKA